jgi:hypothetical protein
MTRARPKNPAPKKVTFNDGAVGTVTQARATSLTVTLSTKRSSTFPEVTGLLGRGLAEYRDEGGR